MIHFLSSVADDQIPRVVVTGHMIDRQGQYRFPSSHVPIVWYTLGFWLEALRSAYGRFHLITSSTPGVDLLAVSHALLHPQPTDIFLPQAEDSFLARSITSNSSQAEWQPLYQAAKVASFVTIHEPVEAHDHTRPFKVPPGSTKQHYIDLNVHLASLLRPGTQDTLLAYWDGHDGPQGGTAHLVKHVYHRGIRCWMLCEGLVNANPRYDRTSLRYTSL